MSNGLQVSRVLLLSWAVRVIIFVSFY